MSDLITLSQGDISATIDLQGAWLTKLQAGSEDMLFPRQSFTLPDGSAKLRGGSHVCFPNFGPGGDSDLPQHGFARTSQWQVVEQSDSKVELKLDVPQGDYADVEARLTYELIDGGITMSFSATNNDTKVMPICPAFHPYFATSAQESIVQGKTYTHANLSEAVFLDGSVDGLSTDGRQYDLEQKNLPQWVLWTDMLGGYVCVEPTAIGNGFEDGTALHLQPGTSWSGSLTIMINERNEL